MPYHYRVFVDARTGEILNSVDEVYDGYATTSTGVLIQNSQNVTLHTWHHDDGFTYLVDASKNMFPGSLDLTTFAGTIQIHDISGGLFTAYIVYDINQNNVFNDTFNVAAAARPATTSGSSTITTTPTTTGPASATPTAGSRCSPTTTPTPTTPTTPTAASPWAPAARCSTTGRRPST